MSVTPAAAVPDLYGYMAEFDSPESLLRAARHVREAGYRDVDAYSPYPIEPVMDALGYKGSAISLITLFGAMLGGTSGYALSVWAMAVAYPYNIAGRPYNSWVSYIPPTFEMTILIGAFSALLGMIILNGLPKPYHPVFNVPRFDRASQDGFFLAIEATDPRFDAVRTRAFLEELAPLGVYDVPR